MLNFEASLKEYPELLSRTKTLAKGQVLFQKDEQAETAYLVREGVLIVGCSSPNGKEVITSVYFPGEVCAGLSVLTASEYLGTARAPKKNATVVTPLSRQELGQLMNEHTELYRSLILTQQEKQKFKNRMLLGMVADSCQQRAAAALLWLHQKGVDATQPSTRSYLCRQELADLIGSTVETVIRVLSRFRKSGFIEENKGQLTLNVPALRDLALAS